MFRLPIYTSKDLELSGMVMAIIKPVGSDGKIKLVEYGKGFLPSSDGITIIIEERYATELEKFRLSMSPSFQPVLTLAQGEELDLPPVDATAQRLQELESEMLELRQQQLYKNEFNIPEDEEAALAEIDREIANREG